MKSTTIFLALTSLLAGAIATRLSTRQSSDDNGASTNGGFPVDTTPNCISDPSGFMTMADARSCLADIAASGVRFTVSAPGGVLCERKSGKFWIGIGGDEEQSAWGSDIAAAGQRILDTCSFKGIPGMPTEMTGGGAYVATNGKMYAMFSKDEQDD
ncbi:hypothetical protein B0T20DRAFT_464841 [Sordaria brevicollis]|uniref:Ecp2 effector protein domain-containing protein n=1 Tax=Sordaria brevicollis TaxID=83679 RepID=A0AAE0NVJ9_SORBR|nr:hypothetical protein B0T20DRAFT_464841 [Sordaria brevicollis]